MILWFLQEIFCTMAIKPACLDDRYTSSVLVLMLCIIQKQRASHPVKPFVLISFKPIRFLPRLFCNDVLPIRYFYRSTRQWFWR